MIIIPNETRVLHHEAPAGVIQFAQGCYTAMPGQSWLWRKAWSGPDCNFMVAAYGLRETADLIYNIKVARRRLIVGLRKAPGREASL